MATETSDVTGVLNDLIQTCKDGEEGFQKAAEKVKEPQLKALFTKYSSQRAGFVQELQSAVSQMGGDPSKSGHVSASLHRGWISVKEALSGDQDTAIVDEAEAGEDAAMKAYREALAKTLPANVQTLVQKQFTGVQEAHGVVRDLKHSRH